MSDIMQRVADLKTRAKNRRDLGRYDLAASLLKQAIDIATREYESSGVHDWRATVASELADCWGILGGIERRWALDPASDAAKRAAHLQQSIHAYDEGYRYECDPEFGSSNSTYNRLNRMIVRLLLHPEWLAEDAESASVNSAETPNVRAELETIRVQIAAQGADNLWSAADQALLNVLLGRQDAESAYATFERKQPPDFAYQSAIDGVTPLAALDLPTATELRRAEQLLIASRDRVAPR
jgi:hypothetical protein